MADYLKDVAIIGAGLGGCALAIALSDQNVPITLYESRPEVHHVIPSGVILPPNGLRVLDRLGILDRVRDRCYIPSHRVFKNDDDETTKKVATASLEKHGYQSHRIWRSTLLDEMKAMLKQRNIRINYNSKFTGVESEAADSVTFLINGEPHTGSMLIASDGVNSSIRRYIAPDIEPEYTGTTAVLAHIHWKDVDWPYPDYERNATIQSKPGAIFWIAEDAKGEHIMIGMQKKTPVLSQVDLTKLQADQDALYAFYVENYEEYGTTAKKIIDAIGKRKESLFIWPFMKMPKLDRWYSETGRIILVGDGAHALPPSSGQGVNQALEDIYFLTLILNCLPKKTALNGLHTHENSVGQSALLEALSYWQKERQVRIDAVFDWTENSANLSRLPEADRKKILAEGKVTENQGDDLTWLYEARIEEKVSAWIEGNA